MCDDTLFTMNCGQCGTPICFTQQRYQELKQTGETFYCSNGHARHFTESENSKLKKRIERLEYELGLERKSKEFWIEQEKKRCAQRDLAERRIKALRGWVTRLRMRVRGTVSTASTPE